MAQIIKLGQPPIDVNIRPSARARRLSLRVSGIDGKVSLTVPKRSSMAQAQDFLHDKEPWIRKHLDSKAQPVDVAPGARIPIEGAPRDIVETATRVVRLHPHWVEVPGGADKTAARVGAFLKTMARDRLVDASEKYAAELGRSIARITLRDTRSRWGSCTSEGNLMYSWRLILAPRNVLDYVAAHEVSHLVEMNHSPAFWGTVETLMPDYAEPRRWLRQNGSSLHQFIF